MRKGRTGVRLRLRLRKERPLRNVAAASAAPDRCLAPPFRLPGQSVTQLPRSRLTALGCFVTLAAEVSTIRRLRASVASAVRGVGGSESGWIGAETGGWSREKNYSESPELHNS